MIKTKLIRWAVVPIFIGLGIRYATNNQQPQNTALTAPTSYAAESSNKYNWNNVSIGGGGFVTGVYPHPLQRDLVYIKTDIGGFYRWNKPDKSWIPLNDQFPLDKSNYYGGEALAVDPNNPNIVYIAVGKYSQDWAGKGTIFKSTNQGKTWKKLNIDLPMGGNEDQRWAGERLAVNPSNSKMIFFGSRRDGLWKSSDAGETWSKVNSFPQSVTPGVGIVAIAFDKQSPTNIFANVYGDGIYKSTDTGDTWSKMIGSPKESQRIAIATNGVLYVTHKSGVSKYSSGVWSNITPNRNEAFFNPLAVDPTNPNNVLVALGQSTSPKIYGSSDGGVTWKEKNAEVNNKVPWRNPKFPFAVWVSAIEFDPIIPGKVWLTDGLGIWQTDNINADPVAWTDYMNSVEETVPFTLVAPPKGALLLSSMADVNGFYHSNLQEFPSKTFNSSGPQYQHSYGLAYSESDPLRVVRVGGNDWNSTYTGATSTDGGLTWTNFNQWQPKAIPLRVAVSATDPNLFVVVVSKSKPMRTTDGGASWSAVSGLPNGFDSQWYWGQPLVADKVDGNTFYYYAEGKVYRSTNGGRSFDVVNSSLNKERRYALSTVPGVKGEVWLSLDGNGLFNSTDGGKTFTKLPSVERAYLFSLGKPPTGSIIPALYLYGKVANLGDGIFRSLDRGKTWTNIGDPQNPIGNDPNGMVASWQQFGLVFIGTNGRGIYYGTPVK